MSTVELLLLAVALAMDAVAVSLALGLRLLRPRLRDAVTAAAMFGSFQALMPVLGWALAFWAADVVEGLAPWIAFALLLLIGVRMIREAVGGEAEQEARTDPPTGLTLAATVPLAVATSIDAAAAGVTFAVLDVAVAPAAALIGVVTAMLCLPAVVLGARAGERLGGRAEVLGGVVLVLIGVRILLDHLDVLG